LSPVIPDKSLNLFWGCKKNKEIQIVAIGGIPKTSHSNGRNRIQPPKIKKEKLK
jgi:hypothetical protein